MTACANDLDKAAFYLCLARAFATPSWPGACHDLRDALHDDLAELAPACGYDLADLLATLPASFGDTDDESLLVRYTRMFLMPGDRHPSLNAAAYLDGAVAGGSVTALLDCYARCGLEKREEFADLPDHVSAQLEFLAWLFGSRAAADADGEPLPPIGPDAFIARFVARWVAPLRADIETAGAHFGLAANPYAVLAAILQRAIAAEATLAPPAPAASGVDPEIARLRAQFAGRSLGEEDLAIVRARLAADGLPSDHVAIPVDERDRMMGLSAMRPPELPQHNGFFAGRGMGCGGS